MSRCYLTFSTMDGYNYYHVIYFGELTEDDVTDLNIYGCMVWMHPETDEVKKHYHIIRYCASSEQLEEIIECLLDRKLVAYKIFDFELEKIFSSGRRIFPLLLPDDPVLTDFDIDYPEEF